jgi:hypothetical protein
MRRLGAAFPICSFGKHVLSLLQVFELFPVYRVQKRKRPKVTGRPENEAALALSFCDFPPPSSAAHPRIEGRNLAAVGYANAVDNMKRGRPIEVSVSPEADLRQTKTPLRAVSTLDDSRAPPGQTDTSGKPTRTGRLPTIPTFFRARASSGRVMNPEDRPELPPLKTAGRNIFTKYWTPGFALG